MSDPRELQSKSLTGIAILFLLVLSWPASCEWKMLKDREETEAVCRRAIERKYGTTAQEAQSLIQTQREWEGR